MVTVPARFEDERAPVVRMPPLTFTPIENVGVVFTAMTAPLDIVSEEPLAYVSTEPDE
jgi:hypothetical protein